LLKVLDGRHDTEPDLSLVDVQAGDRIVLCSDGLCGFVDEDQIAHVLAAGDAHEVAAELAQLALDEHSTDNITVVVADVVEEPFVEQTPVVVGAAADEASGRFSRLRHWTQRDHVVAGEALIEPGLDPEELRYAPREPSRYRWIKRSVAVLVVLGLLFATGAVAYSWTQDQYYVSEYDGNVAIYQGIQADLPGIDLHSVYRVHDLTLDELPNFRRSQVIEGMTADDLEDAERIVAQLEEFANRCARQIATPPPRRTDGSPRSTTDAGGATGGLTTDPTGGAGTTRPEGGTGTAGRGEPETTPSRRTVTAPTTSAATTGGAETGSEDECVGVEPETGTSR
jgi:protein phosphatase